MTGAPDTPEPGDRVTAWASREPDGAAGGDTARQDPGRSPTTSWPLWTVPVVLIGALILTTIASLLIDIPAAALGATVTGSHISPGIQIADTFIQDVCFVLVSIWFAQLGGRKVASWQFGLRRPPRGWWRAIGLIGLLIACFLVLIAVWQEAFNPSREKLLEELGTNEGAALLVLSAALTCIVAPISEEFLFRGYIFTALRNWRGTLPAALITGLIFGGVHAGSAPALDLIPLVGSASGCACCTATPARCTRASPPTRSTTASRSGASRDGTGRCRC